MKKITVLFVSSLFFIQTSVGHAIGLIEIGLLNEATKKDFIERTVQFGEAKDVFVTHFIKKFVPVDQQEDFFTEFKGWQLIFQSGRYELFPAVSPNLRKAVRCGFILGRVFELRGQEQAAFSARFTKEYLNLCK